MKLKNLILALTLLFSSFGSVKADEGMWLLNYLKTLNAEEMKKLGLNMTIDEIYSDTTSSLKDAIVNFGGFCTGSVISKEGLVLTNHHCGYGAAQSHSTPNRNILRDGYWAMTRDQELPNEDLTVSFLVSMTDVTDFMDATRASVPEGTDPRMALIETRDSIIEASTKGTHYNAELKPFFGGNKYFLFLFETFEDIRLVGVPPESIGKFGGDTDNWMWPRHTGDFSMFRIYTGPDGKPAKYSEYNVPLKPKHYLPISLKGVTKNDFSMVLGFPGGTDRYMTSHGIKNIQENLHPAGIKIREKRLSIMKKQMRDDPKVNIQYSSKYARISNYYKNWIGQLNSFIKLDIVNKKIEEEKQFQKWADATPERKEKYGDVLNKIGESYKVMSKFEAISMWVEEAGFGPEIMEFAYRVDNIIANENIPPAQKSGVLQKLITDHFKDYSKKIDKKEFAALLKMYSENMSPIMHPATFSIVSKKYKDDWKKFADDVFKKSPFVSKKSMEELLVKDGEAIQKALEKDYVYQTMISLIGKYRSLFKDVAQAEADLKQATRVYIAGVIEMKENEKLYPDANFTMRLTYGQVLDYQARDAVNYHYVTTLKGVIEKEDYNNPEEFTVATRLKDIYQTKDFGPYGEGDTMPVNFTTNNDITGGNSGSPVINGDGHLIGCAFDGNWEAMSGDYVFEPNLQRCINVDIRYILLVIDKFAGATHLVDEMTLIK